MTFSDADVDLVARAAFTWKWGPPDGWSSTWADEAESHRDMAREVLEALDAAGRLNLCGEGCALMRGAETRAEYAVRAIAEDGSEVLMRHFGSDESARGYAAKMIRWGWPFAEAVSQWHAMGPWLPTPSPPTEERPES